MKTDDEGPFELKGKRLGHVTFSIKEAAKFTLWDGLIAEAWKRLKIPKAQKIKYANSHSGEVVMGHDATVYFSIEGKPKKRSHKT